MDSKDRISQFFALKAGKVGEKFKSLSFGFGLSPKSFRKALSRLKNHEPIIHPPNPPSPNPPAVTGIDFSDASLRLIVGPIIVIIVI